MSQKLRRLSYYNIYSYSSAFSIFSIIFSIIFLVATLVRSFRDRGASI